MSGLTFHRGGGAWDNGIPTEVKVIVIHAGFGDATMLEVTSNTGSKHHYLVDGGPTTMPGTTAPVSYFSNLIETFLKYAFKGTDNVFKAEGIMVTHKDADHRQGVQKLLDKFPPNKDPGPGNAKFKFDGPLLFNSSAIVKLGAISFRLKELSPGDTIRGFEDIFTFYFPGAKGQLYYHNSVKLPLTEPTSGMHIPSAIESGGDIYNPDSSVSNKASILLNVSDPRNYSDIQVSLNGDSVGYSVLEALQGKNPTVFKVPHHGSRKNSIPLQAFEPAEKDKTSRNLAAHALLELKLTRDPKSPNLLKNYQVTSGNIKSFNWKFRTITETYRQKDGEKVVTYVVTLRKGLEFNEMLSKLANEFTGKLGSSGENLLNILQRRKEKIEENMRNQAVDSTQVYTNGMVGLDLPDSYSYDATKRAVLDDAKKRDDDIIAELGEVPLSPNLPYKERDAFDQLFKYLETDRIFAEKVSLHLVTSFYQKIKARTYFISSGDQHGHPNWQVVSGIIQAAQLTRMTMPDYTCRLLLTSGNGIDEDNLPNVPDWNKIVSLQYFGGQTASVTIDPTTNPMDVLDGTVQWYGRISPENKNALKEQYRKTAGALELKRLRSAALRMTYEVKPENVRNVWLNFVLNPKTKRSEFKLDFTTAKLKLVATTCSEAKVGRKSDIVFTLTLVNSSKKIGCVHALIGSNVPRSGIVKYKLFQKGDKAKWQYFVYSNRKLSQSTKYSEGSYFEFGDPSIGSVSKKFKQTLDISSPSEFITEKRSVPPIQEKTANDILQSLIKDPDQSYVLLRSSQNSFLSKFLNWKIHDSSEISSTQANLVLEIPNTENSLYSLNFVIHSAQVQVTIPEKKFDVVIEAADAGTICTIKVAGMCFTQDMTSDVMTHWTLVKETICSVDESLEANCTGTARNHKTSTHGEATSTTNYTGIARNRNTSTYAGAVIGTMNYTGTARNRSTSEHVGATGTKHGANTHDNDPINTLSLTEFLTWIGYSGDSRTSHTVLDLVLASQVTSQLLTSEKLENNSALYKFIKAMLSWNVNSLSSFEVINDTISTAEITLIQPSNSQQFKDFSVSSTSVTIKNPRTDNLSVKLHLNVTDSDGISLTLTYPLEQLIEEFVQALQDYLRAMKISGDLNSYNFFDCVMFLLESETAGYLTLASFTRALVSVVFQWEVNQKTSVVRYTSSPGGPKLLEATLVASIPNKGNTVDLGINKLFQLKSLAFKVPDVFQLGKEEITTPHLTADVIVGGKSARITAVTPQGDDLPSLKIELTQSISLNDILSFLGLDSSIASAHVPMLSSLLRDIQITSAGFTVQQKVLNSNQSWLSSVFFAVQFNNVGTYLPSAFTKLEHIAAKVVVCQPLLSNRKISVNVKFNFVVPVRESDGSTKNVNLAAVLNAEPVQATSQVNLSYNFSVAILISSNIVQPSDGLNLSTILTAFGLGSAVSSAESDPFIKSLLQNVVLRELRIALNTASKSINTFLLKVYIPSWKLFGNNKVELRKFEIYLSYADGAWSTSFEVNTMFEEEYPITTRFDLVSDVNQEARFSFSNNNYEFTIHKFLSVFGLGSLGSIPVLGQVLSVAVTDAKLSLKKTSSEVIATEGKVSLYKDSINIGSTFHLSQITVTIGFVRTKESNYVFGFSVEGFINKKVYLSVTYDPNTQVLSGQALIASFQTADLSEAVGVFFQSNTLNKNSVYTSVSNSLTAAISVAFKWTSGDFSLTNLIVDLRHVFSIGPVNLEQLQFEYRKADTLSTPYSSSGRELLPAGSQIKLIGVLTDRQFSAIVEFDLNKDTTEASTITASIKPAKENTLKLLSFLSLFSITPPTVPTINGRDTPNFFDLALTEGLVELSLADYSINSIHVKVGTTNSVNLLDSPQITLENLSFEVNYSKSVSPTTTGRLLGVITLLGIKVAIQGSKKTDGTVFKAVVGPERANLQEFIKTLTPAGSTSPTIPSNVGLPQPIPVSMAALIIGLLNDKKTLTFKGASHLQWNIELGFTKFQILELGGLVNYIKMRTGEMSSKFSAYVTGKFQFSSSVLMQAELHFGASIDTVLSVLVTDGNQIKVDSVANDLLKFNQPKTTAVPGSSPSSSESQSGAIAFRDLLPSTTRSNLVNLTSAYINLNLSQSVFLLLGHIASLGSGFLLAGKFSPQQTHYGYAFGLSLPLGFKFSQLLSALAPIDDIVQIRKATCVVMSMEHAKVNDVVEKMKAARNSAILPEDSGGLVFPFSTLKLDDATKNLIMTKGMSFYAEFEIPALGKDSIFHSIIQISSSANIPAVIISAMITIDPLESEFRAHFSKITLFGLIEFKDVTMIYRPNSLVTLELHGTIIILLGDTSYSFYGVFTLTKTDAVFSVITSDPNKQVTIHEPLGMFGISLEDARLTLRYNFRKNRPKSSSMEITASVNFYSSDSVTPSDQGQDKDPVPVLMLSGLVTFRNYKPVVVSVTISPTKPLTIADLVATIFNWKYNLDFLNIGFVGGHIYYASLPEGESSITIDNVKYCSGYHISTETEIFDIVFTIAADIPLDKSQISITGYAHRAIDFGFAKFTGKKDSDPSQPDESKSPQLIFTTSSSSTSISIGIGLILFNEPLATADIGYNLTRKVFTGRFTYSGSIGFIKNPSISFEWSKESGFKVTSFPMSGEFDFDLLNKLRNFEDACGTLVDLAFREGVQARFVIDTNIVKTTQPNDFLAEIQITGTYDVLIAGKAKIASVPLPDLSVGIPREDDFSLRKLPQFILDLFTKNADRIVKQIIYDPKRLGAILGIVALKSVSKEIVKTLACRGVRSNHIDPDVTGEDPTEDDFNEAHKTENEFNKLADECEELLVAGELGGAGGAAAAAEVAADGALVILEGILVAIGSILALKIFNIVSFRRRKRDAEERRKRIKEARRKIRKKMKAALDIKQAATANFHPPSQLSVSWNPLTHSGVQYHLIVTATLLPAPGSKRSDSVVIYDSIIPETEQGITSPHFYNVVGITVTVNATLTATSDDHTSTFNGKSYTTKVANVHPTLHAPDHVSATYQHDTLKVVADASPVKYSKSYHFQLVQGSAEPYTVISQSTKYSVPQGSTTTCISTSFDHSSIPSTATGPFKVRCQAVGESGSGIAPSAYTYSSPLTLAPPPKQLTLVLSHFEESSQNITLNWKLNVEHGPRGFLCRIVHKESCRVLVFHDDTKKPAAKVHLPPPDVSSTHSFSIDSVVRALTSKGLIPNPPAGIQLKAQVSVVGNSNTEIDSVFTSSTINSLKPPEQVEFDFSVKTDVLNIVWKRTQDTSTYGIEILNEIPQVVFSKSVTVNKADSKPQDTSNPDSGDHKVGYSVPYSKLSSINDPTVSYTVQLITVMTGNDNLDSLVPGKASNPLKKLPTATEKSLLFRPKASNVYSKFIRVSNASAYLFQLSSNSTVLASVIIPQPTTQKHSDSDSIVRGTLNIDSFIDQLAGGDEVSGTVQALGGGNFLNSSFMTFSTILTVFRSPLNITYSFSPKKETITLTCSRVKTVSEYLLGLLNSNSSEVVSIKSTSKDNKVTITIPITNLNKSDGEWKVFAQSLGNATHFPSSRSFLPNTVHVLPKPEVQQSSFDGSYDVLTVKWPPVANTVSYSLTISAMQGDYELFNSNKVIPSPDHADSQDVVATVSMKNCDPEWDNSTRNKLTLLRGKVVAIGIDYYLSSSPGLMPTISQLDPPRNLKYGYNFDSDRIKLTCDTVDEASRYTLGLRNASNPDVIISKTTAINLYRCIKVFFKKSKATSEKRQVSVTLHGEDLRDVSGVAGEWIVFCQSAGDSTHFSSVKSSLESKIKVLDSPVVNSFTYSTSYQVLNLSWRSVQGASEYVIKVTYTNFDGQGKSFYLSSPQGETSLRVDMNQKFDDWSTMFETVSSIVATIKTIGCGYYITSNTQSSPTIQRLSTPGDVKIAFDDTSVTITWSAVVLSTKYTAVVTINGRHTVVHKVEENKLAIPLKMLIHCSGWCHMYRIRVEIRAFDSNCSHLPSTAGIAEKDIHVKNLQKSRTYIFRSDGQYWYPTFDESHSPPIVGIKAIKICHGNVIYSIQVTYLLADGSTYTASNHSQSQGTETNVQFEVGEEIVKVFGKTDKLFNQLTFVTKSVNGIEREYGPYGGTAGQDLESFQVTGKIMGVFEYHIMPIQAKFAQSYAIGFYFVSIPVEVKRSQMSLQSTDWLASTPGNETTDWSSHFDDMQDHSQTGSPQIVNIRALRICYNTGIYSIQATYILEDGSTWIAPKHGSSPSSLSPKEAYIQFDAGECIKRVDGEFKILENDSEADSKTRTQCVTYLVFTTKKANGRVMTYGPYGTHSQTAFSVSGHVIGLFGQVGIDPFGQFPSICAIGFCYTDFPPRTISSSHEFGGNGGTSFSDHVSKHKPEITGINEIRIRHDNYIHSIQATYRCEDGSTWVAPKHGGDGGQETYIQFQDDEKIVRIEVKTNHILVDQMTFVTQKGNGSQRKYGPFGKAAKTLFVVKGKILGFFGRAGFLLDSIGVHYIPESS